MTAFSRRGVLALLSAVGAMSLGGGVLWADRPEALVRKILANRFPGVNISPASISALTRELKQSRFQGWGRRIALEAGAWAAGVVGIEVLAKSRITAPQFSQL